MGHHRAGAAQLRSSSGRSCRGHLRCGAVLGRVTALIDDDLTHKSLPLVGFANPALYLFAQSPAGLPAPAFHDVILGSNLHYPAGPGWDMATGLGTPDVGALANDFEWYEKTHGPGS